MHKHKKQTRGSTNARYLRTNDLSSRIRAGWTRVKRIKDLSLKYRLLVVLCSKIQRREVLTLPEELLLSELAINFGSIPKEFLYKNYEFLQVLYTLRKNSREFLQIVLDDFQESGVLPPPRVISSWKKEVALAFEGFFVSENPFLTHRPISKRFIGVGYRDKGTARDVSNDGSPSWQEVAMSITTDQTLTRLEELFHRKFLTWLCWH